MSLSEGNYLSKASAFHYKRPWELVVSQYTVQEPDFGHQRLPPFTDSEEETEWPYAGTGKQKGKKKGQGRKKWSAR